jgi:hypothetical protein
MLICLDLNNNEHILRLYQQVQPPNKKAAEAAFLLGHFL